MSGTKSSGPLRAVRWSDSTGTELVRPDASKLQAPFGAQSAEPSDLDWLSMRSSATWDSITLPSPYSPAELLHPSMVFFPGGWRGYRYWCAYTPYPSGDALYENPCVAASNDGETWVAKGAQPLVADPGGGGNNSDTDLGYDAANDRIVLVYRQSGLPTAADSNLYAMVSTDGVTWTAPVSIYTGAGVASASGSDLASPSLMWNSTSAKWEIIGHNIQNAGSAWPFVKITSSSLLSGWDTSLTTLTFTPPSGRKWWHSQFRLLSSGAYVGIVQDNDGSLGSTGNLFAAYSSNGTTFTYRKIDDYLANGYAAWYRPSFAIVQDVARSTFAVQVFGSKLSSTVLFRQAMEFGAASVNMQRIAEIGALLSAASLGGVGGILLADSFNRADDATGLGTATSGATYTQPGGPTNVIGISTNRAYNVATGNCRAIYNVGVPDYLARITFAAKSSDQWFWVRYVDSSNYIRVGVSSSSGQLTYHTIIAGSIVTNTALGVTPANGDEVTVRCCGGEITIFLNTRRVAKFHEPAGAVTGTYVGMQQAGTSSYFENFIVTALA